MRLGIPILVSFFTLLVPTVAFAADYDEAVSGDLSGDRLNPTVITLNTGANAISGTTVSGDIDYYTMVVPAGQQIRAVRCTNFVSTDVRAFFGIQRGATFTEPPTGTNVANLLGYTHFGPSVEPIGNNILDNAATGAGSQGFSGMLGAGQYAFWTQQTGASTAYTLVFDVGPTPSVPVPGIFAGALALGLGFVGAKRLRARRASA